MKLRLIESHGELMVVVGITYIQTHNPPDHYVAIPLKHSIIRSSLQVETINVPFSEALEITDPKRLKVIWVLYGR